MTTSKKPSPTRQLATKLIYAALSTLRDQGKEMPGRDLLKQVEKKVELDEWAKATFEKTGYTRWKSVLHFYSIDCLKAGYLIKKKGVWYITPEGIEALKLNPEELLQSATAAYRKWKAEQPEPAEDLPAEKTAEEVVAYDEVEQTAIEGLVKYINSKNPYEFQDLAAALLRGMGYYTPFVAPKGKDGGVDIVAYRDPLGTDSPRIQVQIKHRDSVATVQEVRQLMGLLQKQGDVGIFISTGGFSADARAAARGSHVHVELIDLNRFIGLWQDFYNKLTDEDKSRLPLRPIYFLAIND